MKKVNWRKIWKVIKVIFGVIGTIAGIIGWIEVYLSHKRYEELWSLKTAYALEALDAINGWRQNHNDIAKKAIIERLRAIVDKDVYGEYLRDRVAREFPKE